MTLSFSTQMFGKPNYFVEKILASMEGQTIPGTVECLKSYYSKFGFPDELPFNVKPKLHTFREDKGNRWHESVKIHYVVKNRTPDRFQFAPCGNCISTQKVNMFHTRRRFMILIDSKIYAEFKKDILYPVGSRMIDRLDTLAVNDGFENFQDFMTYFKKDFTGKIIHWTPLKYQPWENA